VIFTALYIFVLYKIPTAILIAIYAGCRNRRKENSEIKKNENQGFKLIHEKKEAVK